MEIEEGLKLQKDLLTEEGTMIEEEWEVLKNLMAYLSVGIGGGQKVQKNHLTGINAEIEELKPQKDLLTEEGTRIEEEWILLKNLMEDLGVGIGGGQKVQKYRLTGLSTERGGLKPQKDLLTEEGTRIEEEWILLKNLMEDLGVGIGGGQKVQKYRLTGLGAERGGLKPQKDLLTEEGTEVEEWRVLRNLMGDHGAETEGEQKALKSLLTDCITGMVGGLKVQKSRPTGPFIDIRD